MMFWTIASKVLLIFGLRLIDVSFGTIRLMMIGQGRRKIAALLGFIEVTIWVMAISQVVTSLDNIYYVFAYSGGFAAGTLVGMWIEDRLALGSVEIDIISLTERQQIVYKLRQAGYGVTELMGMGKSGDICKISTIVSRKDINDVLQLANQADPKSFIVVDSMKAVKRGYLHSPV
jgi:uncharacterized protein YebE (UPF0316 family)